ncbi:MAG: hypothetical protein H7326_05610 [Bdellovibrionaceae bacterium]|nr:hypothetical protein [Pseudobdellovibrionaceae bacterium]
MTTEDWEMASYVVTVFGFPLAILAYFFEQRKERQNEEEEIYQKLSDEYADFSKVLLENADLRLMSEEIPDNMLSEEQIERKTVIFDILISLFERAYILVYEDDMSNQTFRLWKSWDDYIRVWCRREDFRLALPALLEGEDPAFVGFMKRVAKESDGKHLPKRSAINT